MLTPARSRCEVCQRSSYFSGKITNQTFRRGRNTWDLPFPLFDERFDCPRCAWDGLDQVTGELVRIRGGRCRLLDCSSCLAWKANRVVSALHIVEPKAFATFGGVAETPVEVALRMTKFRRYMRKKTEGWQDAYFVERSHFHSGYHVHLFAHEPCDEELLRTPAKRSGFADTRNIDCQSMYSHAVYGYPLKEATRHGDQAAFRDANRGRVVHATKDFWRGPHGVPVPGGYDAIARGVY